MTISRSEFQPDWDLLNQGVALRLAKAREGLKLTQAQFGYSVGLTRAAIGSYEEGRAVLRCDMGLRICRHFFISELWLATGSVDEKTVREKQVIHFPGIPPLAKLTMSLGAEQIALTLPPGISFAEGFHRHLKAEYFRLAKIQDGFPRIVTLPPHNDPAYLANAVECMLDFWTGSLPPTYLTEFFSKLIDSGNGLWREMRKESMKPHR